MAAASGTAAAAGSFGAILRGERAAAAAGAGRVRVVDLEAAAHHVLHIVHGGAVNVVDAHRVHDHLDSMAVEDNVFLLHAVIDGHAVVEPGASAARHEDT